jgi:hypothetical protein
MERRGAIRYELYLREKPKSTRRPEQLLEELAGDEVVEREDDDTSGRMLLRVSGQYLEVEAFCPPGAEKPEEEKEPESPRREDGPERPSRGLDFTLPTGLLEEQARAMIEKVIALAQQWDMKVFDPQLGRAVKEPDTEIMVARWREQNDYLLKTVGSDGSTLGGGAHYPEYSYGLGPKAKFWLFVAGVLVALVLIARFCS